MFFGVTVGVGGYGAVWNDDLDLSSDELWENGADEWGAIWSIRMNKSNSLLPR